MWGKNNDREGFWHETFFLQPSGAAWPSKILRRSGQALDAKKAIQLALDSRLDELKMDHAIKAVRQARSCVGW